MLKLSSLKVIATDACAFTWISSSASAKQNILIADTLRHLVCCLCTTSTKKMSLVFEQETQLLEGKGELEKL